MLVRNVLVVRSLTMKLKLLLVTSMLVVVAGCGQKGPLYLPQEKVENSVEDIRQAAQQKRAELEAKLDTEKQE